MLSSKVEISEWYEVLKNQALESNDKSVVTWSKYKNDLEETKSLLSLIPKKIKHDVMLPMGPKALIRGKIVHTNEILVNLGETWFISCSANKAIEVCDRRIKTCEEMLKKLEIEMQLIVNKSTLPVEEEAFGSEERPEIIEYITEEENEECKKLHKLKEKKYRQQLAELRNSEKKNIETQEDLWKHLDELELQEELEDELNRLNAECSNEGMSDEYLKSRSICEQDKFLEKQSKLENPDNENKIAIKKEFKKKVSFVCDYDFSDGEPLRLEIKHSEMEPASNNPESSKITSPRDIYDYHRKLHNIKPSVLKNCVNFSKENNVGLVHKKLEELNCETEEEFPEDITTHTNILLKDVFERNVSNVDNNTGKADLVFRKISKFKTSRMKNA